VKAAPLTALVNAELTVTTVLLVLAVTVRFSEPTITVSPTLIVFTAALNVNVVLDAVTLIELLLGERLNALLLAHISTRSELPNTPAHLATHVRLSDDPSMLLV
jgi:hypothetical protein